MDSRALNKVAHFQSQGGLIENSDNENPKTYKRKQMAFKPLSYRSRICELDDGYKTEFLNAKRIEDNNEQPGYFGVQNRYPKRNRIPPVKYWMNTQEIYQLNEEGFLLISNNAFEVPQVDIQKKPLSKPQGNALFFF